MHIHDISHLAGNSENICLETAVYRDRGDIQNLTIDIPDGVVCRYFFGPDATHTQIHRTYRIHSGASLDISGVVTGTHDICIDTHIVGDSAKSHVQILAIAGTGTDITLRGGGHTDAGVRSAHIVLDQTHILLGSSARVRGMPILDIATDDIQGGHSCRVYRIDEMKLFYLQSRGIDAQTAEHILLQSEIRRHVAILDDCDMCDSVCSGIEEQVWGK
jgi:hypothetical protein